MVVRCVRINKRSKQPVFDFPWLLGGGLCFREKVAEVLKDMLEKYGELLPLITEEGENLYVHNTSVLPNALDEERTEFLHIPGIDRVMGITKAVFRENIVRGVDMFRVPPMLNVIYVSDRFVDLVNKHNLKGIKFRPRECR
jgi:hypothetical protein